MLFIVTRHNLAQGSAALSYHNGFQHFGCDGGKDPLVEIHANVCIYPGQLLLLRTQENSQRDVHVLQICTDRSVPYLAPRMFHFTRTFAASEYGNSTWLASYAEDNRSLNPRDDEVGPFSGYDGKDSPDTIKDHCPLSSVHCR